MLKSLCNSIYRINSRKDLWIQQLKLCSMVAEDNTDNNSVDANEFSKTDVILKIVNKSNLKKLKRHMELAHAEAIISGRNTDGKYKSLNDLMSRNKLGSDVLDRMYNSINTYKPRSKELLYKSTIIPALTMEQIPEITLGIHVGQTLITWALVTNTFEVLKWDHIQWYHENQPKNSYDIIKLMGPIFKELPTCETYVTEDMYFKNVTSLSKLSCQYQLTVAIMAGLTLMKNQNDSLAPVNNVYILKPRTSARFHNLIVGSEIISPSYFMKKIINNDTKPSSNGLEVVYISDVQKYNYLNANIYQQEEMSWCLLKALTFMRLVQSFILNEDKIEKTV